MSSGLFNKIQWGDGLAVTDEGDGVIRVDSSGGGDGTAGPPGPAGPPGATGPAGPGLPIPVVNGQWIKGAGGAAVWSLILVDDVAGAEATRNKDVNGGYVGRDSGGNATLPGSFITATQFKATTDIGGIGGPFRGTQALGSALITNYLNGADSVASFRIIGSGQILWGPGGSTEQDTFLYRGGVNTLNTGGAFQAGWGFTSSESRAGAVALYALSLAPSGYIIAAKRGDSDGWRVLWTADGTINWGDGTNNTDTNLYRSAAGVLRTDGTLDANALTVNGVAVTSTAAEVAELRSRVQTLETQLTQLEGRLP